MPIAPRAMLGDHVNIITATRLVITLSPREEKSLDTPSACGGQPLLTATDANAKLAGQRGEQCQSTLRVHLTTLQQFSRAATQAS